MRRLGVGAVTALFIAAAAALVVARTPDVRPTQQAVGSQAIEVDAPRVVLTGLPFSLTVRPAGFAAPVPVTVHGATGRRLGGGLLMPGEPLVLEGLSVDGREELPLSISTGDRSETSPAVVAVAPKIFPGWTSLLPPLLAIVSLKVGGKN